MNFYLPVNKARGDKSTTNYRKITPNLSAIKNNNKSALPLKGLAYKESILRLSPQKPTEMHIMIKQNILPNVSTLNYMDKNLDSIKIEKYKMKLGKIHKGISIKISGTEPKKNSGF